MNRISYLAGIHIFQLHIKQKQLDIFNQQDNSLIFSSIALDSMFAYFFSKIINPHRKCDMYMDLQQNYKESEFLIEKQFIKLSIESLDKDFSDLQLNGLNVETIYEAALIHGHILGEYLYRTFVSKKIKSNLQDYFKNLEISSQYFQTLRQKLIPLKEFRSHQKRYF